jgi:hypothetical protein
MKTSEQQEPKKPQKSCSHQFKIRNSNMRRKMLSLGVRMWRKIILAISKASLTQMKLKTTFSNSMKLMRGTSTCLRKKMIRKLSHDYSKIPIMQRIQRNLSADLRMISVSTIVKIPLISWTSKIHRIT